MLLIIAHKPLPTLAIGNNSTGFIELSNTQDIFKKKELGDEEAG
jgi:hypothetical protein